MLAKAHRLRRSREFHRVRRRGKSWTSPLLILHATRGPELSVRAGFSVNKKVGKATIRNRVKRRLREIVRANLGQIRPGYDLILTARPTACTATFGELRLATEDVLRRASLLQDHDSHA